jgi:hypothetical protein
MVRHPQGHRWRSLLITTRPVRKRQSQSPVGPMEVVIEELQTHQRIPRDISLGERVRLAGKSIEPIAASAPLSRSTCTVPAGFMFAPSAARISTDMRCPCSSRCLPVCVNVTVEGTTHGGRPRLPVNLRWR